MSLRDLCILALLGLPLPACSGQGVDVNEITKIENPFTFCIETVDSDVIPENRTEGAFPTSLSNAMVEQGLIAADAPPWVKKANSWRCMAGEVWVCSLGANLPCGEKADLSRKASPAFTTYCRDNPDTDIPAYVTGRAGLSGIPLRILVPA